VELDDPAVHAHFLVQIWRAVAKSEESLMKVRTPGVLIAAVAAAAMLLAGCTPPLAKNFQYPQATLGLQGGSVDLVMTFTCQRGWNIAFGDAHIAQSDDGRLAQGFGSFAKEFPGVPCTGRVQGAHLTVFDSSDWAFTTGTAAVDADLFLFNENTTELPEIIVPAREIRVVEASSNSRPAQKTRPTPDPRYTS
jgi:hypothetical protein